MPIQTREEDEFKLRPEALRAAITPRSKILLLNFPTNPTGAVLTAAELEEIAAVCRERNLLVITDEIYSELSYGDPHVSIASLPGMRERTIFLHGFSKAFAMTGFRIGYACAPPPLLDAMMRIHQYGILCAPIVSQEAALEALLHGRPDMIEMREHYRRRRNFLVHSFRQMGLSCFEPRGAFYLFLSIKPTGLGLARFRPQAAQGGAGSPSCPAPPSARAARATSGAATPPPWRSSKSRPSGSENSSAGSSRRPPAKERSRRKLR